MTVTAMILVALTLSFILFTITWIYSRKINNYSIVDVVWSYAFAVIAALLTGLNENATRSEWILTGMFAAWSIRLGSHLGSRVFSHLDHEDGRYLALREEYGKHVESRFFRFFMMQAVSVVFLLAPLFVVLANPETVPTTGQLPVPSPLQILGVVIWMTGWLGESLSDAQLAVFKRNPENRGKVCEVGLWSWSRHPNYFFETIIWVGFGTYALSYPYGWIALSAPLTIGFLITKVTGMPFAEAQSLKSRGNLYRDYQTRVSRFFPWPPKRKLG